VNVLSDFLLDRIHARREKPIGRNLLDNLILAGLSDQTIHDQMLTMLIAGHDTSTAVLTWTLVLLEQHPTWKFRLQDEIRSKLGDEPPRDETTRSLPILNAVIKETLRLYPPIHVGNRITTDNITLGGYPLPAGQRVMLSIYLVHRHPQYWQDANNFQPERWMGAFRPASFSYIPFGGGPRNCIGGQFAQVEARIVLARILQKHDFHVQGRILPWMNATLEPHSPYWTIE
jgi:cytochrome P450